ncbi:hypothetical protein BT67DRAFT_428943 [Trichocladium antarcticum]|uniref:Required for respiratory growth protein 7, mitochondrial n=1 Tax=Trichocladium antarcticum TaxID=1450529 RepID=A0AAN6UCZ4_9PEZI|nr:hypothetical protein BT67DRAFT_428943 [Trichocladium antarcticum]
MRASLLPRLLRPRLSLPPLRRSLPSAATTRPTPDPVSDAQQPEQAQPTPPSENDAAASTTPANNTPTPHITRPLIYPSAPSPHHNSLPTFLAHAQRTALDPSSTVYVGTHFEYTTLGALARLGFALHRVGGASDCGIDLLGTWSPNLPPAAAALAPLRVLVQCKAVQRPGPQLIRELEGAFVGAPAGWRGEGVLGVLVAERAATKGIRDALGRSRWPMAFVACSREGALEQMLWNGRAEEEGLRGLGVGVRYGVGGPRGKELVLTWRGRNLPGVGVEG